MLAQNTLSRTWFTCALISTQLACGAPTFIKMDPSRAIERDNGYQQGGQDLDPEDMTDRLAAEPEAAPHVSRSKTLNTIGLILAAAGGALVGWPIGAKIGGEPNPPWGLAAAGGGAILVSVPLMLWGVGSFNSAVDAHNAAVAAQPR